LAIANPDGRDWELAMEEIRNLHFPEAIHHTNNCKIIASDKKKM
jgi:hypothetical protein